MRVLRLAWMVAGRGPEATAAPSAKSSSPAMSDEASGGACTHQLPLPNVNTYIDSSQGYLCGSPLALLHGIFRDSGRCTPSPMEQFHRRKRDAANGASISLRA